MKDVFGELEAEVAQNVVDRKHDAIEWKNLLTANDNLIAECLSKEVFSVATNYELNVARFTKMHVANTIVEARCLELEVELANLRDKSHHDNQEELINHFSKLEQYKELYDSIKITRAKHIEQVTALTTKNVNLKAQILEKVNSISKDHTKPKVLVRGKYAIDVEPIVPRLRNNRDAHLDYLRHLKESVETIHDIVDEAKVISSVLIPNLVLATPYVPPTNKDLEILFQPIFDEYLKPPRVERPMSPAQGVQAPVNLTGTPSSTTIDQDAPSPSISPSSSAFQSHQGIAAKPTFMGNNPVAPVDNNPFINVLTPEPSSDASSS
nr:hypothetical protein [Tanacetum cinerariifolium]